MELVEKFHVYVKFDMKKVDNIICDLILKAVFVLLRVFCRFTLVGEENIPSDKGALIVCNHVSFIDGLFIRLILARPVRFIVDKYYYDKPFLKPFCKLLGTIPISEKGSKDDILGSLLKAREHIERGGLICIFAEGAITRNGMLQRFKSGFKRIMEGVDVPVLPAFIGGAWETVFSYCYGKPLRTIPKRIPYHIDLHIGEAIADAELNAGQIRQKVSELSCEYFEKRKTRRRSLGYNFIRTARKNWYRKSVSDPTCDSMRYLKLLVSVLAVSDKIKVKVSDQDKVGVLLPNSVASVIVNFAVTVLGKVAVNLNYTASKDSRDIAIKECGLKTILTSKSFLKKLGNIEKRDEYLLVEEIIKDISQWDRLQSLFRALFYTKRSLTAIDDFNPDKLAAVVYSSGTSGKPKGVMLSHHNIMSNIEGLRMIFRIQKNDDILGVLPFFHSFGYTCTMWLPLVSGVSASYVPTPLDGELVGKLAKKNQSTMLLATPTFITNYVRRTPKECFASLRMVVVGAEKLKRKVADSFRSKFDKEIYEGYGATELSPVATLNVGDVKVRGRVQKGSKEGAIGHPIPGVAIKVLDVETERELPLGERGLLYVKGPNVMLGYLGMEDETAEVLKDGWYCTGDIVERDEDGFVTLADRLSRFSKIGGEMIPHLAIEEVYMNIGHWDHQVIAVSSVPDERRGEVLVVLYLPEIKDKLEELHKAMLDSDLPNLWKPRRNNYFEINEMPLLGSGKLDVLMLKKIAIEEKLKK